MFHQPWPSKIFRLLSIFCITAAIHATPLQALSLPSTPILAGLIDLPDAEEEVKVIPYNELRCLQDDQDRIADIIITLGSHSGAAEIALLAHYPRLNSHEKVLRLVHPLKFIETVFVNPELRNWLPAVMNGFFTRHGFFGDENTNGLAQRLTLHAKLGKVECYREDFARALNIPAEDIRPYFEANDWEGLMDFLIDHVQ